MRRRWKIVLLWVLGAFSLFIASWISGNLKPGLGVEVSGLLLASIIAFIFFLIAGLLWMSAAIASRKVFED